MALRDCVEGALFEPANGMNNACPYLPLAFFQPPEDREIGLRLVWLAELVVGQGAVAIGQAVGWIGFDRFCEVFDRFVVKRNENLVYRAHLPCRLGLINMATQLLDYVRSANLPSATRANVADRPVENHSLDRQLLTVMLRDARFLGRK